MILNTSHVPVYIYILLSRYLVFCKWQDPHVPNKGLIAQIALKIGLNCLKRMHIPLRKLDNAFRPVTA